jgi:NADH-quinone oxidoreductase subunit F
MSTTGIIQRLLNIASGSTGSANSDGRPMRISAGPLLADLTAQPAHRLADYRAAGGYAAAARIAREGDYTAICDTLEEAGLRGRAGGGFPTGHKWRLVARNQAPTKYFICNANSGPGDAKVPYVLGAAPHKVIEAVCVAALAVGASTAYLAVPTALAPQLALLEDALRDLEQAGLIGKDAFGSGRGLEVRLVPLPAVYIIGEETALLEYIENRPPRPRGKPPLPTARGLFGAPTLINNLETVLHAAWVLQHGAAAFRARGTANAPGTLLCSVGGDVAQPGLYELPLGTLLSTLIHEHAGGVRGGGAPKLVFPGGLSSPPLSGDALDVPLDYDALQDRGSDLGSGTVLVVGAETSAVELAMELATLFHEGSCGKCQPCKDGTARTLTMLERLQHIDERSIDLASRTMPPPKRRVALQLLNVASTTTVSGISYTDGVQGIDKITTLCQFYKHRGDCHHSYEAASVIQALLTQFRSEFEERRQQPAEASSA